ncbi:hypothetical protein BN7_6498 [Wickerhamomyces ciferrii]|uniref:Uncharacterized protein n=1 Tax=Wickerhamomyces ciferrii (strain ATCC 14091 / BCRC 22168 / CBS 111 / JCM 3599 / NBRC 0793 / NRRL Y-1031 F-60-10) TaxID=1206466 RepID=K0KNP8_WICCF|nr:uncharacterized protein BN7_6498 [Wickerhamomyces ciferrii]CCH46895.1 hypothetical protein BN7_6498 [Wickerhamomyces ciferrii]
MNFENQTEINIDDEKTRFLFDPWFCIEIPNSYAGGKHKMFNQGDYPPSLLHSNIDTLRNGAVLRSLSNCPGLKSNHRPPSRSGLIIARQIIGENANIEGFSIKYSLDKVVPKPSWWFGLLPYERYSVKFFTNRSNLMIAQLIGGIRVKIRHIYWKSRMNFIYPLRLIKDNIYEKIDGYLQQKLNDASFALKKLIPPKTKFDLFSLGDKPSMLGPFPIEIWLKIIEQSNIGKKKAVNMIYNSMWIDLIAPILYTNIHCFLSIRDTSMLRIKDHDFVHSGPSLVDYGYSDYNKYARLNKVKDHEFEVLDLYPSSKGRMETLINTKTSDRIDQSSISIVLNHKSLLKLVRTLNTKNSIMKKYLKNISLDVFDSAPCDWINPKDSKEVKERIDTLVKHNHKDKEIQVLQTELAMAKSALVHINEFDHVKDRRKQEEYQGKKCHNSTEKQHYFEVEDLFGPGLGPQLVFAKQNYTSDLDLFNKILECFINGSRNNKVKKMNENNIEDLGIFSMLNPPEPRPRVAPSGTFAELVSRFPIWDDKYHKLDISIGDTSYLKNKGELAEYVDEIINSFLGCINTSCSIMIVGIQTENLNDPINFCSRNYTVYLGPELITINTNT